MGLTAGLILAVSLVTANVWAAGKSDPCAAAKQACKAANKAEKDAQANLDKIRQNYAIAYKEYQINSQEFDAAFDKWTACLETGASCTAEAQVMEKARSRRDRADNEYLELAKQEQTAMQALEKASNAADAACQKYAACLQKNAKPKPKPKPKYCCS